MADNKYDGPKADFLNDFTPSDNEKSLKDMGDYSKMLETRTSKEKNEVPKKYNFTEKQLDKLRIKFDEFGNDVIYNNEKEKTEQGFFSKVKEFFTNTKEFFTNDTTIKKSSVTQNEKSQLYNKEKQNTGLNLEKMLNRGVPKHLRRMVKQHTTPAGNKNHNPTPAKFDPKRMLNKDVPLHLQNKKRIR